MPAWRGSSLLCHCLLCCCIQGIRAPDCLMGREMGNQPAKTQPLALAALSFFGPNSESTTGLFKSFLLHHSYVWQRLNVVQTKSALETYLIDPRQASLSPQAAYSRLGKDKQHYSCGGKGKTCALNKKKKSGVTALQFFRTLPQRSLPQNTLFPSSL